jgi:hypothetical protein
VHVNHPPSLIHQPPQFSDFIWTNLMVFFILKIGKFYGFFFPPSSIILNKFDYLSEKNIPDF